MTRKNILNKTKSRFILTLITICVLCMSIFFVSACSNTTESTPNKDTNYTYSEENTTLISNSSFAYGTADLKISSFPKSSVTGWSKKTETDMSSSSSKYGVIDVSEEGWENLVKTLYGDSYFLNYFKIKYDFEESDVKSAIKNEKGENHTPTSEEIKNYIIKNYFGSTETFKYPENTTAVNQFKNPGTHEGAVDSKVYMLNNYLSKTDVGRGTAQNITSASTITLNKGEFGKVSVWVKTQNLSGLGVDYGANIRLTNTFNSSAQAQFGIYNITDTEWTQYTIYVKADEVYATTFTLVLGLGADRFSATEGTAYFDDVQFEHVTAEEYAQQTQSKSVVVRNMNYNVKDQAIKVESADVKSGSTILPVLYDMSMSTYLKNNAIGYKNALSISSSNVSVKYTTSNKVDADGAISGGRFDDKYDAPVLSQETLSASAYPYATSALKAELNKSSYTITFAKNSPILVAPESYAYVEFFVKNELSELGASNVTVDIFDISGQIIKKRAAVASISTASEEWTKLGVIVKNNFETGDRAFYFDVVIGPTDVAAEDFAMNYATGIVTISQPTLSVGSTNQYVDEDKTEKTENYDLYSLFNATSNGSTALYAGSASDFSEVTEETESYDLTVAPSDIGTIETKPATPSKYKGIVANHFYITDSAEATTAINTSETAGLINTKYLNNYNKSIYGDIAKELDGAYEDDIQPLMIYNKTATQYGYISESSTIAASAFAKFEASIRVTGDAKAFVYLVNTDGTAKDVLTFEDFTVNANKLGESITDGKSFVGADMKYCLEITSDMMGEDGWINVEFYLANGASAKSARLEIWNGSRDAQTTSAGYVFVKSIHTHISGAFTEAANSKTTWTTSGNPLYTVGENSFDELLIHKRDLTTIEKQFNDEQTDESAKVSYQAKYVWAKNETMIYGVYNTIDPVETDPYANQEEDDETEEEKSGCTAESDPATFWLSFSSILLGVALVLALAMLVAKNAIRRRKANASDAKSHYKVTSRTRQKPKAKAEKKVEEEVTETEPEEEVIEESTEESQEEQTEETEQNLDEYVYGDVQDFGEEEESSEDKE